jgi:hypothetical protein
METFCISREDFERFLSFIDEEINHAKETDNEYAVVGLQAYYDYLRDEYGHTWE